MVVVFEAFSLAARAAVTQAHQEARSHGSDYIGTEHLLLGLLDRDTTVSETLEAFNVTVDAVRSRVEDSIGPSSEPHPGHLPFSPRAKSALQRTRPEAEMHGRQVVEPPHIMAAIMFDAQSAAAKTIARMNLAPTTVRERLLDPR